MLQFLHWLVNLGAGRELGLWVSLSLALYALSAHVAWRLHDLPTGLLAENIRWLAGWRFRGLAWQLVRLLYYVVIPYGLLVQRHLFTGRQAGLVGPEPAGLLGWSAAGWLRGLGSSLLIGGVGVLLVGAAWWALSRRLADTSVFFLHPRPLGWELVWDAFFLQVHWAFYRVAAMVWLGEAGLQWAVLLGLLLVALEAASDPGLYLACQWPARATAWVRLAAVAWHTAVVWLLTRNLYLSMAVHWAMSLALNGLAERLLRSPQPASAEPG